MDPLAKQAATLYEITGAAGLENFVRHAREADYREPVWSNGNSGTFLLDHSSIRHCRNQCRQRAAALPHFHFTWQDADGQFNEKVMAAPDPLASGDRLHDHLASLNLVSWPNTESIQGEMLRIAMSEAGLPDEDFAHSTAGLAIIDTLAPSNRLAINDEILEDPVPSTLRDHLDGLQYDYADDARRKLPPDQWTALVNFLKAHQGRLDGDTEDAA